MISAVLDKVDPMDELVLAAKKGSDVKGWLIYGSAEKKSWQAD